MIVRIIITVNIRFWAKFMVGLKLGFVLRL